MFKTIIVLLILVLITPAMLAQDNSGPTNSVFEKQNLVAWCIVPFDAKKRTPRERSEMLNRIGITRLAYDYRAENIPSFEEEIAQLKEHGIELTAWWFPGELNEEAKHILDLLEKHQLKTQLWVTGAGEPVTSDDEQQARVATEAERIGRIAQAANKIGCEVGLYNHGGWFGEPENQLQIIQKLGMDNVGIVYNLHHGHDQVDRFEQILASIKPHLLCLNLNGMTANGDQVGKKILPIGEGEMDVRLLKIIQDSGYTGPIGILNHTDEDAETRLLANLTGLDSVVAQIDTKSDDETLSRLGPIERKTIESLVATSAREGDPVRGLQVFASTKYACLSCHKVGLSGGDVGPALTEIATKRSVAHIATSIVWPQHEVETAYQTTQILMDDGRAFSGYVVDQDENWLFLKDASSGEVTPIGINDIEIEKVSGSVMPAGLVDAMRPSESADLLAFMSELGTWQALKLGALEQILGHYTNFEPAKFEYATGPINPSQWTQAGKPINRNRLYEYYQKQARHFSTMEVRPPLLAGHPGLDGTDFGHWGNQDETSWGDGRWNETELGSLQMGVFRGHGLTVRRAICLRLGDNGELSACFNPETLAYELVWKDGFVNFSSVRHGFMDGLAMAGQVLKGVSTEAIDQPFQYHGFYRLGRRVVFAYKIDDVEYLDSAWVDGGQFVRTRLPREQHPLVGMLSQSDNQWPQKIETAINFGTESPYAVDRIELPKNNPWNALVFCGDHDFLPTGDALVATMQGDVWQVGGLDFEPNDVKAKATWRRFAAGLNQSLGLKIDEDGIFVLGRDQITRLHDLNGDGEADYYEAFCTLMETSPAGHDYICGLQRDREGFFYTASGNQGILKISADGQELEVIATGFRNPDGLGIRPDGSLTVPCSEGTWTPASMICEILPTDQQPYFGYPGPRDGQPPELPLVYLPRGIDNSSGGQVMIDSDRWGPLRGGMIHLSYGAGTHLLLLRDEVNGQSQGAVVPLPGDFASGVHRGRFRQQDGQLYVTGMAGWGTYTSDDGCFARVRYTGERVQQPVGFHVHSNGVMVQFSEAIDVDVAEDDGKQFAQNWNYRYSAAYGSAEYATVHAGVRGHDVLLIKSAHVMDDQRTLFLEIPDLQPVNQLHLQLQVGEPEPRDIFMTVHALDQPFKEFAGYRNETKIVRPHPMLVDMSMVVKSKPNPYRELIDGAREVRIATATNLSYETREFVAKPAEAIALTLVNLDVVPHNWALLKPDSEVEVGELANRLIADPEAAAKQYVPDSDAVLVFTDVVEPNQEFTIYFKAPKQPGRYPYICTFPGHWMVMRGSMLVE